ncbi:hypothetical protein BJ165DRAFT_1534827 [Panaeolus papilionaceus]|nr:hypothetical protein BJ165DRAFT_1534827 [Panaeolus papilionaceus]
MEHGNAQLEQRLADPRPTSSTKTASGAGKKKKRFLEKNDALSLAASIAETQEKKSSAKIHKPINEVQSPSATKPKKVSARHRIKEKKALLQAQRADAKRNKTKSRKKEKSLQDKDISERSTSKRKGVSFA